MNSKLLVPFALAFSLLIACSSGPQVKQQAYAKLPDSRVFEYEFPTVWSGIEETFKNFPIVKRDPKEVGELEMEKLTERTIETDFIYTNSRDKYQEYKINGIPKKKYLQSRVKYTLTAKNVLGGVSVAIRTTEEIEKLKPDGSSAGYSKVKEVDTSRPAELLDKIQNAIHYSGGKPAPAAPPIGAEE
jgi:hypothetical protein